MHRTPRRRRSHRHRTRRHPRRRSRNRPQRNPVSARRPGTRRPPSRRRMATRNPRQRTDEISRRQTRRQSSRTLRADTAASQNRNRRNHRRRTGTRKTDLVEPPTNPRNPAMNHPHIVPAQTQQSFPANSCYRGMARNRERTKKVQVTTCFHFMPTQTPLISCRWQETRRGRKPKTHSPAGGRTRSVRCGSVMAMREGSNGWIGGVVAEQATGRNRIPPCSRTLRLAERGEGEPIGDTMASHRPSVRCLGAGCEP